MIVVNLNWDAIKIVAALNSESAKLKIMINLGGFAWIEDADGVCAENGFCLVGNSHEVQRKQIKQLAIILGIVAIVV